MQCRSKTGKTRFLCRALHKNVGGVIVDWGASQFHQNFKKLQGGIKVKTFPTFFLAGPDTVTSVPFRDWNPFTAKIGGVTVVSNTPHRGGVF